MSSDLNADPNAKSTNSAPRQDLINTAVKFLQNPNVINSPLADKQKFLISKGLSDEEIRISCEKAGAFNGINNNIGPSTVVQVPPHPQYYMRPQVTTFGKIKDILNSTALFGGILYGIYLFYKKFIRPWLFGEKKKKPIEDAVEELNTTLKQSLEEFRSGMTHVQNELAKLQYPRQDSTQIQLEDLKGDMSTVKGLLLGRKQFSAVPAAVDVPPSIPAWQLSSVQAGEQHQEQEHDQEDNSKAITEDLMDMGSGSGSSEAEAGTKNSDSSLEIM